MTELDRAKTVCFTGHRPHKIGGYKDDNPVARYIRSQLKNYIGHLNDIGFKNFITGMALGVDTIAANVVLEFIQREPERYMRLICAVPFEGQESMWPKISQNQYRQILNESQEVHVLYEKGYEPWKMLKRDEWMVDHASLVIAVWDGSNGGTGHTVNYAKNAKHKPELIIINPNQQETR